MDSSIQSCPLPSTRISLRKVDRGGRLGCFCYHQHSTGVQSMSAARKRFTAALTVFILFSFAATPTSARDIRILTPYLGYISNACDNEEQDIELHNGGLEIIRLDRISTTSAELRLCSETDSPPPQPSGVSSPDHTSQRIKTGCGIGCRAQIRGSPGCSVPEGDGGRRAGNPWV